MSTPLPRASGREGVGAPDATLTGGTDRDGGRTDTADTDRYTDRDRDRPVGAATAVAPAERGATTIADRVVRRIAARSSLEALPPGGSPPPAAAVSRSGRTAAVELRVSLPYGADLAVTGAHVQRHVARRTAELTGLTVPPPEVRVTALNGARRPGAGSRLGAVRSGGPADGSPGTSAAEAAVAGENHPGGGAPLPPTEALTPARARRPWSPRRLPALVVAFAAAAGAAYLLSEAVARRTGHAVLPVLVRPDVLHRVATASLSDPAALVAGAVALGCGLWLLGAAVLPGLRNRLPMTVRTADTRAVLDRTAVGLLLRDGALAVPGVTSVRVRVGRRRAKVRARAGYGELDSVRKELTATMADVLDSLGLARPLRPRVRLRADPQHVGRDNGPDGDSAPDTGTGTGRDFAPNTEEAAR
ncbi:DUF6286 domain-containing Asp23/Gls24 family envelope stress response protein [Streptomyces sp. NPDC004111]|uniref:DUF6286 domain-containing Asp23/Gls24 family envelope stress response protein n=1 Tax=Streptomyces sp. NPDC004111 TaxID=3364690 RepID=UPI0036762DF9